MASLALIAAILGLVGLELSGFTVGTLCLRGGGGIAAGGTRDFVGSAGTFVLWNALDATDCATVAVLSCRACGLNNSLDALITNGAGRTRGCSSSRDEATNT